LLDLFKGFAQASSVDEFERDSVERDAFGDEVAGCARNWRDNGAIAFDKAVEERAFAGVGTADDGHCQSVVNDASASEGGFESSERRNEFVDAAGDFGLRRYVYVVFGEVDSGFEERDEFDKGLLDGGNATAERSSHLACGLTSLREGLRFDEVTDGFGLSEIEFSGEERALGELSWFGEASTESETLTKEEIENDGRAVSSDFDEVVAGVGIRGGEEGDDGIIDLLAGCVVKDSSETGSTVFEGLAKKDELRGDGRRIGAAETDDAYSPPAGRGGDGGDGIGDGRGDLRDCRLIFAHAALNCRERS